MTLPYADSSNVTSINSLLSEARKYRVALITATQFLTQIDKRIRDAVFGNVGTLISMRVGIDDAHILQKELGQFTDEDLLNLRVGEAIVRMGMAKDSFNLQVPLVEQPSDDFTKEILELAKRKKTTAASPSTPTSPQSSITTVSTPQQPQNQLSVPPLPNTHFGQTNFSKEERNLLEFIYKKNEPLPFTRLAKELNISTRQLYKSVGDLTKRNLICEVQINLAAKTRKSRVIILTADGITALGYCAPTGKGGAAHQYFQHIIKFYAQKQGYKVAIEKHLGNQKSIDVSLEKDSEKVAVEISVTTTAANEIDNIEKCLVAGYTRVFVLCSKQKTVDDLENLVNQHFQSMEKDKIKISLLRPLFHLLFRSS